MYLVTPTLSLRDDRDGDCKLDLFESAIRIVSSSERLHREDEDLEDREDDRLDKELMIGEMLTRERYRYTSSRRKWTQQLAKNGSISAKNDKI